MGRLPWAPDNELKWLEAQVPAFHTAQTDEKTSSFLSRTETAYYDAFWKDPDTGKYRTSMLDRNGRMVTKEQRKSQLHTWFWNRRLGKIRNKKKQKKGARSAVLDLVPKKTAPLQPYQAYMNLYKDRIMPVIRKEYEEYLKGRGENRDEARNEHRGEEGGEESGEDDDADAPVAWWKFACARARVMVVDESDEVLQAVEARIKDSEANAVGIEQFFDEEDAENSIDPADLAKSAKHIQHMIDLLPKTLQGVLARVEEHTGWKSTILVGGPRPDTGEFEALFLHQGATLNLGKHLPDATPEWDNLQKAFNQFVVSCYPADIGKKLCAAYREAQTDDSDDAESTDDDSTESPPPAATTEPQAPAATSQDTAGETGERPAAKKRKKKQVVAREPDYEDQRQATLASNRALFEELGLGQGLTFAPKEKKPRKKREKQAPAPTTRTTRQTAAASHASDDTNSPSTTAPSTATSSGPATSSTPTSASDTTHVVASDGTSAPAVAISTGGIPAAKNTSTAPPTASSAGTTSTSEATVTPSTGLADGAIAVNATPSPASESPTVGSVPTPRQDAASGNAGGEPAATNGAKGASIAAAALSATTTSAATPAPSHSTPPAARAETALPTCEDQPASTDASDDAAATALPDWVDDAMSYFTLVNGGEAWRRLVSEWLDFEKSLGFGQNQGSNKRLSLEFRPEEVKMWMKNGRHYEKLPRIKSPAQFAVNWKKWWVFLQPSTRSADNSWPLPRTEPVDPGDWDAVAQGGSNGFFLVVLTLAWWLWAALNADSGVDDVLVAVEDVSWVCQRITAYVRAGRVADLEEDEQADVEGRPSKRPRLE